MFDSSRSEWTGRLSKRFGVRPNVVARWSVVANLKMSRNTRKHTRQHRVCSNRPWKLFAAQSQSDKMVIYIFCSTITSRRDCVRFSSPQCLFCPRSFVSVLCALPSIITWIAVDNNGRLISLLVRANRRRLRVRLLLIAERWQLQNLKRKINIWLLAMVMQFGWPALDTWYLINVKCAQKSSNRIVTIETSLAVPFADRRPMLNAFNVWVIIT